MDHYELTGEQLSYAERTSTIPEEYEIKCVEGRSWTGNAQGAVTLIDVEKKNKVEKEIEHDTSRLRYSGAILPLERGDSIVAYIEKKEFTGFSPVKNACRIDKLRVGRMVASYVHEQTF